MFPFFLHRRAFSSSNCLRNQDDPSILLGSTCPWKTIISKSRWCWSWKFRQYQRKLLILLFGNYEFSWNWQISKNFTSVQGLDSSATPCKSLLSNFLWCTQFSPQLKVNFFLSSFFLQSSELVCTVAHSIVNLSSRLEDFFQLNRGVKGRRCSSSRMKVFTCIRVKNWLCLLFW